MIDRLFFIQYTFSKITRARDFVASKQYGSLEKQLIIIFIADECASHVTPFSRGFFRGFFGFFSPFFVVGFFYIHDIQTLSLELAVARYLAFFGFQVIVFMAMCVL